QQLLLDEPGRFDDVEFLDVGEHVWRHTPFGSKYVAVIIDLTPNPRRDRPFFQAAGHRRRPLQEGVQSLVNGPVADVSAQCGRRRDGLLSRIIISCGRRAARRGPGEGAYPLRRSWRGPRA